MITIRGFFWGKRISEIYPYPSQLSHSLTKIPLICQLKQFNHMSCSTALQQLLDNTYGAQRPWEGTQSSCCSAWWHLRVMLSTMNFKLFFRSSTFILKCQIIIQYEFILNLSRFSLQDFLLQSGEDGAKEGSFVQWISQRLDHSRNFRIGYITKMWSFWPILLYLVTPKLQHN